MARHTDNNHNVWYDGVTLTNCQYVHVAEGCTGTILNANFVEIGENNTNLSLSYVNYCTIGDNNKGVTVSSSNYIIIGSDGEGITVGMHTTTRYQGRTGAESVTCGYRTIGAEVTGYNSTFDRSRNLQIDGTFNNAVDTGVLFLDNANGNKVQKSSMVDLQNTHNNTIETVNINLKGKQAFMDYALVDKVTRVQSTVPVIDRQSDTEGTILDRGLNDLINTSGKASKKYVQINGIWTEIN